MSGKKNTLLLPDVGDIIFLFVFGLLVFVRPHYLFSDGSTGWHLVNGQYILSTGSLMPHDMISYTFTNSKWVAFEWMTDLFMATIEQIGGLPLLNICWATSLSLLFLALYQCARKTGLNFLFSALLVMLGAMASSVHWLLRPHVLAFWWLFIFSRLLEKFRQGTISFKRMLTILSITILVWTNTHPSFSLGLILIGIYLVSELIEQNFKHAKSLAITLAICSLCTLINPFGLTLHASIIHCFKEAAGVIAFTDEFQSPSFHGGIQSTSLEILFALFILGLAFTQKRLALAPLLTSLAFAHLALSHVRGAPLYVIIALTPTAYLLSNLHIESLAQSMWLKPWLTKWTELSNRFDATESACKMHAIPIAVVLITTVAAISRQGLLPATGFDQKMPSKTLEYIEVHKLPANQGFNFDNWGGYINYKAHLPVFIDDRTDFYGQPFYLEYAQVSMVTPEWSDVLNKHQVNWVLFPKESQLVQHLKASPEWKLVSEDDAAALFVRASCQLNEQISN